VHSITLVVVLQNVVQYISHQIVVGKSFCDFVFRTSFTFSHSFFVRILSSYFFQWCKKFKKFTEKCAKAAQFTPLVSRNNNVMYFCAILGELLEKAYYMVIV